jgi:hypothetical protein
MDPIHSRIVDYLSLFSMASATERDALVERVFVDDCRYEDPSMCVRGASAMKTFLADVRSCTPDVVFRLEGEVDAHHDRARFRWSSRDAKTSAIVAEGLDVVTLHEGRIAEVMGFVDRGARPGPHALVTRYLEGWNVPELEARRAHFRRVFVDDCSYVDPHAALRGSDALAGFVEQVRARYPGIAFVLGDTFEADASRARFTWHAMAPGVLTPVAVGFDVVAFEDGRIRDVHGFLDLAPPA